MNVFDTASGIKLINGKFQMKQYICAFVVTIAFCFAGAEASRAESALSPDLAIVGGQLVDGYGGMPLQNSVILVSGNRIVAVGQVGVLDIPATAKVINSNGMTVLPGLWESHGHLIHVGAGVDPSKYREIFTAQAREIMAANAKISLLAGVTTFRDEAGPLLPQLALRAEIESGKIIGPRLFLAGPILKQSAVGTAADGDDFYIDSVKTARQVAERLIAMGVDKITVGDGFWDLEILKAITATAHNEGLIVEADVVRVTAWRTAMEAGVDVLHHPFVADSLSDYSDEDIRLLVRGIRTSGTGAHANIIRGPYIVPTVEMRQAYVRVLQFPELLDDPRLAEHYPPNIYEILRESWANPASVPWGIGAPERMKVVKRKLKKFIAEGGREQIVAGTDAGSPFNLHSPLTRQLQHLFEAGLTAMEVIQSATLRPAQMQRVENELGTVTVGKLADMIIVDGDPLQDISLLQHKIVLVIKDGQTYPINHSPSF